MLLILVAVPVDIPIFTKTWVSHTGIDISQEMITIAEKSDLKGDYRRIKDGDISQLTPDFYDLIFSSFTFDNIPLEKKSNLFSSLSNLLNKNGTIINLVCSPDIYTHEWASFSTKDFPENKQAKSGDVVSIITTDLDDKRPCYDIVCSDADYKKLYTQSNLKLIKKYKPLATGEEPYNWVNETTISPWTIYILKRKT